jgi:hypothetical protein
MVDDGRGKFNTANVLKIISTIWPGQKIIMAVLPGKIPVVEVCDASKAAQWS